MTGQEKPLRQQEAVDEEEDDGLSSTQRAKRNPSGLCRCGCGERTTIAPQSNRSKGWVKGEPLPYVNGHYKKHLHAAKQRGLSVPPAVTTLPQEATPTARKLSGHERREVELLYVQYRDHIHRRFRKALDYHLAEDLVHDTYVRICETLHYRPHARNLRAWVVKIADNLGIDRARRADRESQALARRKADRTLRAL